jgi:hypothetical protein
MDNDEQMPVILPKRPQRQGIIRKVLTGLTGLAILGLIFCLVLKFVPKDYWLQHGNVALEHYNPIPLTANQWKEGIITGSAKEVWYSFPVKRGTEYSIWLNGLHQGDNTKTLDVRMNWFYGSITGSGFDSGNFVWDHPNRFTADSTGTVYVRVYPESSDNSGTYGIVYSTDTIRPGWKPSSNSTLLRSGQWEEGNITGSVEEDWYSFHIISGTQYYIWLNSLYRGDGTKTMTPGVSIFYNTGEPVFAGIWYGWDRPLVITADSNGTFYVRVYPKSSDNTGTYGIAYSTDSVRPGWEPPSGSVPLASCKWEESAISSHLEEWFSFPVTGGVEYHIWFNSVHNGDGTKTLPASISAFYSNLETIFTDIDSRWFGWERPASFTANLDGMVHVRVYPSSPDNTNGSYGIAYSTRGTRPDWKPSSNPILLVSKQWTRSNYGRFGREREDWYSFPVTGGTEHYVWLNSLNQVDGGIIYVSAVAFYSNGEPIFNDLTSVEDRPKSFTASSTGMVYIRVFPPSSYNLEGVYYIVCSTDNTRPGWESSSCKINGEK